MARYDIEYIKKFPVEDDSTREFIERTVIPYYEDRILCFSEICEKMDRSFIEEYGFDKDLKEARDTISTAKTRITEYLTKKAGELRGSPAHPQR